MRSAAVALFAGLATASYLPPAPVYEVPGVSAPASSEAVASSAAPVPSAPAVYPSAPAEETEYSTKLVTITSCGPDVPDCPAGEASTVISSSLIPLTTSTIYATTVKTIHSCAPEVTDCPYATEPVYVTETIAISTTVCPVSEATATPSGPAYPPVVPSKHSSAVAVPSSVHAVPSSAPAPSAPGYPVPSSKAPHPTTAEGNKPVYSVPVPAPSKPVEEESCPTVSVKTIVYTTAVPTVLTRYETATVEAPCPEATTPGKPSVVVPPVPGHNSTVPAVPTYTAPVAAGAAGVSGSVLVAAMAAIAAYAFA